MENITKTACAENTQHEKNLSFVAAYEKGASRATATQSEVAVLDAAAVNLATDDRSTIDAHCATSARSDIARQASATPRATAAASSVVARSTATSSRSAAASSAAATTVRTASTLPNARSITDDEFFFGHKACAGCGGSLVVRAALKVLGPNAVCALPAGCMSAVGFNFPQLCFANNAMITPFAATASVLSGIEAGLRAQGKNPQDYTVVGFAGDGGTADIGIQALSGAIDRNDNILYICYDNEAYMNTGIQKSSLTPFGAKTTTTPAGRNVHGCLTQKKNMFEIVAAHGIPYAATASIGYLPDFMRKVQRAASIHGTKYLHVIAPCPTGWGCAVDETVELAKEVVDCGLWYLAEYEGPAVSGMPGGQLKLNRNPKQFSSVEGYLRRQGRFRALTEEEVARVADARDAKWEMLRAQAQ